MIYKEFNIYYSEELNTLKMSCYGNRIKTFQIPSRRMEVDSDHEAGGAGAGPSGAPSKDRKRFEVS